VEAGTLLRGPGGTVVHQTHSWLPRADAVARAQSAREIAADDALSKIESKVSPPDPRVKTRKTYSFAPIWTWYGNENLSVGSCRGLLLISNHNP
jgi:hypothetical protein